MCQSILDHHSTMIAFLGARLCIILVIATGVLPTNVESSNFDIVGTHGKSEDGIQLSNVTCNTPACFHAAYLITKNMDKSVNPCDDFYKFACGNFLQETHVSDDRNKVDTFSLLGDEIQRQLRKNVEEPISPGDQKHARLVKNLYKSCINEHAIQNQGFKPLLKIMEQMGGWPVLMGNSWNDKDFHWIKSVYDCRDKGYSVDRFFEFSVDMDVTNSSKRIITLDQPFLGLPHEMFVGEEMYRYFLEAYRDYMINVAVLFGASAEVAKKELNDAFEFEKALAIISLPEEIRRNIHAVYNPMTIKEMSEKYSSIPWKEYINRLLAPEAIVDDDEIVNVIVPNYLSNFERLINITSPRTQANYVMWKIAMASVPYLNEDSRKLQLEYLKKFDENTQTEPRWKECIATVTSRLALGLSSLYIKEYFHVDAKTDAVEMVNNIRNEFNKILKKVDWMDEDTRQRALEKAASMSAHIGYPDELLDDKKVEEVYNGLELSDDGYLQNMLNLRLFATKIHFGKLRKPIVKSDWISHGRSAIIGAFSSPTENSIQFPAAIFQGQFFDRRRPKYMNYGEIGYIVGQEITAGFNNQGRQFDKDGNRIDWWTPSTEQKYSHKAECLINQYNNYIDSEVGLHLNGILTLDQNIADNGGIKVAYLAYKKWASKNEEEPSLPGLDYTPKQLFWINAASVWCMKHHPSYLKESIKNNKYSPGEFRVLGPFSNMFDFANDFNCPKGSKMHPDHKCTMW